MFFCLFLTLCDRYALLCLCGVLLQCVDHRLKGAGQRTDAQHGEGDGRWRTAEYESNEYTVYLNAAIMFSCRACRVASLFVECE